MFKCIIKVVLVAYRPHNENENQQAQYKKRRKSENWGCVIEMQIHDHKNEGNSEREKYT